MFVAIRDVFLTENYGFKDPFEALELLGINNIELWIKKDMSTVFKDPLKNLTEKLSSRKLKVCAILVENDLSLGDREEEKKYIKNACKICSELNCNVVRINSFMSRINEISMKEYIEIGTKYIKEYLNFAKDYGISLAMENHGLVGNNIDFIRALIREISSEFFGITFDTGNFYWYGYPLYQIYDIAYELAPYIKHTHIKNFKVKEEFKNIPRLGLGIGRIRNVPLYEGDINFRLLVEILKDRKYDKDLTIEDESLYLFKKEERKDIIKSDVEHLKPLIK